MFSHSFVEDKDYCVRCGMRADHPSILWPCEGDAHEPENAAEALKALIKAVEAE